MRRVYARWDADSVIRHAKDHMLDGDNEKGLPIISTAR